MPAGTPAIDMSQVQARKDKIVTGLTKGVEFLFKKNKIDWIKGTARLAGKGKVEVVDGDTQTLEAKEIIVATGSSPRSVPGIEIDHKRIITSDEAIDLKEVPKSLVIMGSGAVGVEFASIYRRFGSEVTIIELLPRLVPVEDEAVSAELEKSFKKQGIKALTGTKVTKAAATAERRRHRGADARRQDAEAVGRSSARRDRTRSGDDRARRRRGSASRWSAATSRWTSCTARRCRTSRRSATSSRSAPASHPQLAHVSSAEGILVAERIAGQEVRPINYDHVPGCTYCDPEIGSVGLTEAEAKQQGYDVRVGIVPVRRARPREDGRRDRRVRQDRGRQEVR